MPTFGKASKEKLEHVHPDLRRLMWSVIKAFDFTIVWGYRGQKEQNAAYDSGASKLKFPDSKHNSLPCRAVDIAPWPEVYGRTPEEKKCAPINFALLAGFVLSHAKEMDIAIRWGGDFNRNMTTSDENFKDLGHFEIL